MDQGDDLSKTTSLFLVSVTGQIESGDFFGHDNIYCKFWFTHGPDWVLTAVRFFLTFIIKRVFFKN